MGDFFDATLQFPAVVFTFPLLIVIGYWLFAAVTGVAEEISASDGTATDSESPADGGFTGMLSALGLGGVPVTVVLSLVIAVAWFVALTGVVLVTNTALRAGFLLLALYAGWQAAWLLARPLRRLLHTASVPRNADFVGLIGEVRVGCGPSEFGQAEVTGADGGTALIDIRVEGQDPVVTGEQVLIYDYDPVADFFRVAPAGAAAGPQD